MWSRLPRGVLRATFVFYPPDTLNVYPPPVATSPHYDSLIAQRLLSNITAGANVIHSPNLLTLYPHFGFPRLSPPPPRTEGPSPRSVYRVYTWGREDGGRLGLGSVNRHDRFDSPYPTPLPTLPVTPPPHPPTVACGFNHTLVAAGGLTYAFGRGTAGRLGVGTEDGSEEPDALDPVVVADAEDAVHVTAGGLHSGAVAWDGSAYVWGFNGFGALGLGVGRSFISGAATHVVKRPKRLHGPWELVDQHVKELVCGPSHTAVLSSGGLLFTCGQVRKRRGRGRRTRRITYHPTQP